MSTIVSPKVESQGYIEELLKLIESGDLEYRGAAVADISRWRAFRYSVKSVLQGMRTWKPGRLYRVDPLPKRISIAFADFLFGEDPICKPPNEADLQQLKDLLRENKFTSKCRVGEDICVSEGEVYYKIYTNEAEMMYPQVEFYSRVDVIPYLAGDKLLAVAFVTEYTSAVKDAPLYRHLEIHEDGRVANFLYKAEKQGGGATTDTERTVIQNSANQSAQAVTIGTRANLTDHVRTKDLDEDWTHGLPMLAGRIRNEEHGESVYDGVEDFFLDLNEAHTVDAENFRLAGKKRAMIPKKYADQAGQMDSGEEIFWTDDDFNEMDGSSEVIKILEYSYDGASSVARKDDLEQRALTRVGLARQLVDANANEGLAQTGTALRTRLLPTNASLKGKAKEWQDELPKMVSKLIRVDNLPSGSGGFSRGYTDVEGPVSVVLAPPFPADETEDAQRHQTMIAAELESIETAIEELRPGWSPERRQLEVKRILANRAGYALDDEGNPITLEGAEPPRSPGRTDRSEVPPGAEEDTGASQQEGDNNPPQPSAESG